MRTLIKIRIVSRLRWWCLATSLLTFAFAWTLSIDNHVIKSNPALVYVNAVPLELWAAGFAVATCILIAAAVTRRALLFIVGHLLAGGALASWFVSLVLARVLRGAPVTISGLFVYAWMLFVILAVVTSPAVFERYRPK